MAKDVFGVGSTGVRSVSPVASLVQGLFQRVMQEPQRRQAMEAAKRQALLEQSQVEEAPLKSDLLRAQIRALSKKAEIPTEGVLTEEEALRRGSVPKGTRLIGVKKGVGISPEQKIQDTASRIAASRLRIEFPFGAQTEENRVKAQQRFNFLYFDTLKKLQKEQTGAPRIKEKSIKVRLPDDSIINADEDEEVPEGSVRIE